MVLANASGKLLAAASSSTGTMPLWRGLRGLVMTCSISKWPISDFRDAAATGPVPKKTTLFIREEIFVIFNILIVIEGLEVALVIKDEEGVSFVFDVIDEEDSVEMINFVLKNSS